MLRVSSASRECAGDVPVYVYVLAFSDEVNRRLFISICRDLFVMLVFLVRSCILLRVITWRHLLLPTHIRGVMCYVTAVFAPVVAHLAVSHTLCIFFSASLLGCGFLPDQSRSWAVREVLLLRHAVYTMLVVCRMGLSVVFLGVLHCVVVGIVLAVAYFLGFECFGYDF